MAAPPEWSVTPSDFQYSQTFTVFANVLGDEQGDTNDIIGAFINNALVGSSRVGDFKGGRYIAYLTVYSNELVGDSIKFRVYDAGTDSIYQMAHGAVVASDAITGSAQNPYVLYSHFVPKTSPEATFEIAENSKTDTYIGFISATDVNPLNQSLNFELDDTENLFSIDFNTGAISYIGNGDLDYETKSSYTFIVTVTNDFGLKSFVNLTINLTNFFEENELITDNFFSPNGDGINETWIISSVEEYEAFHLYVFNSLGNIVYETVGYQNDWNGTKDGVALTPGTYYYVLTNNDISFKGSISLVR